MSNARATRNEHSIRETSFLGLLGKNAGWVLALTAVAVLFAIGVSPHGTGQRTVTRNIPACETRYGIDALAAAGAQKSIPQYFLAGMANRCRMLDAGAKVTLIDSNGFLWWRATIRTPDGKILYTDNSALD